MQEEVKSKHCNKCKKLKPYFEYNVDTSRKVGLRTICRDCVKTYTESYTRAEDISFKIDLKAMDNGFLSGMVNGLDFELGRW